MATNRKPVCIDLFCGAGGASIGYARAGFEVVGVDNSAKALRHYPYDSYCGDWQDGLEHYLSKFKGRRILIAASPPCQGYSDLAKRNASPEYTAKWPKLVEPVREKLRTTGCEYVIENVEGAPLYNAIVLCGTMFPEAGLRVLRHRLFESSFLLLEKDHPKHPRVFTFDKRKAHYGKLDQDIDFVQVTGGGNCSIANARSAMGIDWMTKPEINEAIPPAYTDYVGNQFKKRFGIK